MEIDVNATMKEMAKGFLGMGVDPAFLTTSPYFSKEDLDEVVAEHEAELAEKARIEAEQLKIAEEEARIFIAEQAKIKEEEERKRKEEEEFLAFLAEDEKRMAEQNKIEEEEIARKEQEELESVIPIQEDEGADPSIIE